MATVIYDRRKRSTTKGSERAKATREYLHCMRNYRKFLFNDPEYAHSQYMYAQTLKENYNL